MTVIYSFACSVDTMMIDGCSIDPSCTEHPNMADSCMYILYILSALEMMTVKTLFTKTCNCLHVQSLYETGM